MHRWPYNVLRKSQVISKQLLSYNYARHRAVVQSQLGTRMAEHRTNCSSLIAVSNTGSS